MTTEIKQIILEKYFDPANGIPNEKELKISTAKFDENQTLEKGYIMIQLEYVSVDPYLRARLTGVKTFVDPFKLHEPINSGCVAKVIKSNDPTFKEGDHISGYFNWQEKQIVKVTKEILKADPNIAPLPAFVGVVGMTGITAYFGLMKIGKPKEGETLVVTAAAGAVGSIVGQIGKIHGCRVVGIVGSDEKVKTLVNEFHFDVGLNYNSPTYEEDLKKACPKGVDIFFENVGGKVSDPILFLLNKHARMPVCGTISMYNKPVNQDIGQRAQYFIFARQALMQGFLVFDYSQEEYNDAFIHLSKWLKEGKIVNKQVIANGFDQIIPSFLTIFETKNNKNIGKVVIKL